jgi:hypothetical protein
MQGVAGRRPNKKFRRILLENSRRRLSDGDVAFADGMVVAQA